jgi:glycosyltransferase involved in cell wall biosynthesis
LFSVNKLEGKEALPLNVTVFEEFIDWQNFRPLRIVFANLFSILGIYLKECFILKKILPFKKSIALLSSNIFKAECAIKIIKFEREKGIKTPHNSPLIPNSSSLVAYSFWFYDCIYLAWMRKKGWIKKAVTRAHSGDLYEDHGSIRNKILFRNFQFQNLDGIYPISKMGADYFINKYPKFKDKIVTHYLGTKRHENTSTLCSDKPFTIVSCASFRHHKRIHKIAEMLQHIDFPIRWFHIGEERLESKDPKIEEFKVNKEKLKSKTNIEYISLGLMSNEEIFEFYQKEHVNLFVSLSAVEGVPVSIMEAISFGIPVLSTDVGGCREIVTEKTGILIPLETEIQAIAKMITEFRDSPINSTQFRKGVRKFWEQHFDAEKNYEKIKEWI